MFASVAWMEIAGSLLGEVVQNAVFAATVSWMPNFVFMIDAVVFLLAALLTMCAISCIDFTNFACTQLFNGHYLHSLLGRCQIKLHGPWCT